MPVPRTRRLTPLIVLVALAAPLLAGCGTASTTSTTANPAGNPGATKTSSTSRTTASATTSVTSTTAAKPTGGPGACRAAKLVLTYLGGQGATGHGDLGFALRNKGRRCHTYGYPGIQFLDHAGKALPTIPTHSSTDFFGHSPLRALSVAPGASVSFRLDISHGSGSPGECPTAAALAVIPPDDTHALSTPITNGAYECGHAIVSPLQPGLSAHP